MRAKEILLDSIACALAAEGCEELPQIQAFAVALGGAPQATVIGDIARHSLASAVLLNGYRITAVTVCDVYTVAHCHVTPEVVPPALALAERQSSSGARTLLSVIAGLASEVLASPR